MAAAHHRHRLLDVFSDSIGAGFDFLVIGIRARPGATENFRCCVRCASARAAVITAIPTLSVCRGMLAAPPRQGSILFLIRAFYTCSA